MTRKQKEQYRQKLHDMIVAVIEPHIGIENAIDSIHIAARIGLDTKDQRGRAVQSAVCEIVAERLLPIGATNKGFYMLSSREELQDYVATLESLRLGISNRIDNIIAAYAEHRMKQAKDKQQQELF